MFDEYIIKTVITLLLVLLAATVAHYDYFKWDKRTFIDLKAQLMKIKFLGNAFNYIYYLVVGFLILINWFAYFGLFLFSSIFFYLKFYIAALCVLLIAIVANIINRILIKHQDSPNYHKKFAITLIPTVVILSIIVFFDIEKNFLNTKTLSSLDEQKHELYSDCYNKTTKNLINNSYQNLDDCNNIEKNIKVIEKFIIQKRMCAEKILPENKFAMILNYVSHLVIKQKEFELKKLKHQHKCNITEEK